MTFMKNVLRIIGLSLLLGLLATPLYAQTRYSVGGQGGIVTFTGGDIFKFKAGSSYGASVQHHLSDHWQIGLGASWFELGINDLDSAQQNLYPGDWYGSFQDTMYIGNAEVSATRLNLMFSRLWLNPDGLFNIETGLGGGLLIWEIRDADSGIFRVQSDRAQAVDYSASELILSGAAGLIVRPTQQFSIGLHGYGDYLTGAGTNFAPGIDDTRNRFVAGARISFNLHFGSTQKPTEWRSETAWTEQPATRPIAAYGTHDSDGDGVTDDNDQCFNTPRGAIVDRTGCPVDSDRDGVADGLDDCPSTPAQAAGTVDMFGCPVDSDFDGLPDFFDQCPNNEIGAQIDANGCPLDGDNDGVPDGLDDCPYTLVGVEVDKHGCIDLSMFAHPMVLHIDYAPGSFEVDPNNLERLKQLAGTLNFVSDLKLEINGYTDNIGTSQANKQLSEKRARRVRDYLVTYGVDSSRITVNGRGETDFIADNQTARGRERNRRIEIVFFK